jgi:hypothetical protein
MDNPIRLSPPERQTLKHLAEGEYNPTELDWVALHRLKRRGLAKEQSTGRGVKDYRRFLRRAGKNKGFVVRLFRGGLSKTGTV